MGGRDDALEPGGAGAELRHAAPRLLAGGVGVYAFLAVLGLLLTRVFADGPVVRFDESASRWFLERRTPALDLWTHVGSTASDTLAAIALTAVVVAVLRLRLHRWREAVAVVVSIAGELFVFVLVTATVARQRPAVPHLDPAPPTSSFPSGHTGAAVALYGGLAVILLLTTRRSAHRGLAVAAAIALCCVPVVVASTRLYRGMHFVTDVLAGFVAGGLWMWVVVTTLLLSGPGARGRRS